MSGGQRKRCPECGGEAVSRPPTELVPWDALGIAKPDWSHRDGTSLCPVIGPSGGYQPARPQPQPAEAADQATRLEPPATLMPSMRTEVGRQLAEHADPGQAAGTAGSIGRDYMTRVIARLGDLHHQAASTEPEPEAGA